MSFRPTLHEHTVIPLTSQSSARSVRFTYSNSSLQDGPVPEVWTSLPSGHWHAVPFTVVSYPDESGRSYEAAIPLADAAPGTFEYTFRLQHPGGGLQWLGSAGSNGSIQLVQANEAQEDLDLAPSFAGAETVKRDQQASLASFKLQPGPSDAIESFKLDLEAVEETLNWKESTGLVLERSERIWYLPRQLAAPSPIAQVSADFDTLLLYLRSTPSISHPHPRVVVLLAFSTADVSSSLRGGEGSLWLRCTRDSPKDGVRGYVAAAWGKTGELQSCVARCVKLAAEVLGGAEDQQSSAQVSTAPQSIRACTWNALDYNHYTLADVLPWAAGLKRSEVGAGSFTSPLFAEAVDTILLDDGWQDTNDSFTDPVDGKNRRVLRSFGVKPSWYDSGTAAEAKEGGKETRKEDSGYVSSDDGVMVVSPGQELADAVQRIKKKGFSRVGVWMTLEGYWDGLSPDGPLADAYGPLELWTLESRLPAHSESNTHWYLPPTARLSDYYHDYFSSLKSAGIDFVKVDDQAHQDYVLSREGDGGDAGELRTEMLRSMRTAADKVFGPGTTIHCMAGSPRIWGGELALVNKGSKSIVRNSDDYFPDTPSSHRYHIFVNSLNTLLTRSLNVVPDFDMCQERLTDTSAPHPWGSYHIAFRAFSPASTYSTDSPAAEGFSDPRGWQAMLGWSKKGARIVKTTDQVGTVLEGRIGDDVLGEGDGEALKVGLAFPAVEGAHIGLWHVRAEGAVAKSSITDQDVAHALPPTERSVVVYIDGEAKEVSAEQLAQAPEHRLLAAPLHRVSLDEKEFKIATVPSLHLLSSPVCSAPVQIACLGLLDKHTGLAAVSSIRVVHASSPTALKRSPPSAIIRRSTEASDPVPFPQPAARSRLAFLFHCLIHRTATSSSPFSTSSPRTVRGELQSLGRDLLRRPFATLTGEVGAVISFTWAIWLWVGSRLLSGRREKSRIAAPAEEAQPDEDEDEGRDATSAGQHLHVDLLFVSPRLGFYVAGDRQLQFKLDGVAIEQQLVSQRGGGVVEVDVEGAWRAQGAPCDGDKWSLEVEVV